MSARISRRALLRGGAAAIALPLLDAMGDEARAQGAPATPSRLIAFYFPHGVWRDTWTPAEHGASWAMTPSLTPLAEFRAELTVISGLDNEAARPLQAPGGPHSVALGTLLTGLPTQRPGTVGGPSWDRVAAAALDAPTRFRSLCAVAEDAPTVHEGVSSSLIANYSWDGPSAPLSPARTPRALFDRLFGAVIDDATARRRRSVLDHTREALARLGAGLGAADRARVDQHLTAIRELERELFTPSPSCAVPATPGASGGPAERARQLARLLVIALRCDLTRVASLALGNGLSEHVLSEAGAAMGHHEQSHRPDAALFTRITAWQMEILAHLARELAGAREGEDRLLDRTVILATSEVSEGWSHSSDDLPCLLLGRGGGLRGGVHRRFAGESIARAQLTAMRAAGARVERFGLGGSAPLPGLLS